MEREEKVDAGANCEGFEFVELVRESVTLSQTHRP